MIDFENIRSLLESNPPGSCALTLFFGVGVYGQSLTKDGELLLHELHADPIRNFSQDTQFVTSLISEKVYASKFSEVHIVFWNRRQVPFPVDQVNRSRDYASIAEFSLPRQKGEKVQLAFQEDSRTAWLFPLPAKLIRSLNRRFKKPVIVPASLSLHELGRHRSSQPDALPLVLLELMPGEGMILVFHKGELTLHNGFAWQNPRDLHYFVDATLSNEGLDPSDCELVCSGFMPEESEGSAKPIASYFKDKAETWPGLHISPQILAQRSNPYMLSVLAAEKHYANNRRELEGKEASSSS